jgi:hypothetical protein
MTGPTLAQVVRDPNWIPHTFDASGDSLTFVHVPGEARTGLMFLSDEHFAGKLPKAAFPAGAVAPEVERSERTALHFIFHTSFCCSTLLAKALEVPGKSVTLQEPDVLINLANRLIRSDDAANRQRLELVLRLLERPFASGEAVIVKPTNFANRLLDLTLAKRENSNAVLLYSDVGTFLRSLLKRGMFGRIFGRRLFNQLRSWSPIDFGFAPEQLLEQTDAQIAALAWLMQMAHLDSVARAFGPERVMLLDSAGLLAEPASAVSDAQALFGLRLSADEISKIANGAVFARHSKFGERNYDPAARAKEHEAATAAHADELEMVTKWVEAVAAQMGLPMRPGQ